MAIPAITVSELKSLRDQKRPHVLVDVREPQEHRLCRIEGAILIPLGELASRFSEIPKATEVIVHCHHGGRSARATSFLIEKGYAAKNLSGGIDAWSEEIDPSVERY